MLEVVYQVEEVEVGWKVSNLGLEEFPIPMVLQRKKFEKSWQPFSRLN